MSNEEFTRLHNAFGRLGKSHLTLDDFARYVLGGAKFVLSCTVTFRIITLLLPTVSLCSVPDEAKRALFKFFTRGGDTLTLDNLICALVGICRVEAVQAS